MLNNLITVARATEKLAAVLRQAYHKAEAVPVVTETGVVIRTRVWIEYGWVLLKDDYTLSWDELSSSHDEWVADVIADRQKAIELNVHEHNFNADRWKRSFAMVSPDAATWLEDN